MTAFLVVAAPGIGQNEWQSIFDTLQQNGGRALHGVAPGIVVAEGDQAVQDQSDVSNAAAPFFDGKTVPATN